MSFGRDSFPRCYLEAFAYLIAGNLIMAVAKTITGTTGITANPLDKTVVDELAHVFSLEFLIPSGIMIVPLFAAILVGSRRSTAISND